MSVDLGLNKIASLELEKKKFLMKQFDANELLNNVKTENMLLLDKVKNLDLIYLLLENKLIGLQDPNLITC